MNRNNSSLAAAGWLLLLAALANAAKAQTVPPLLNYQGKLVGSNGVPVGTGDYELSFRIWDAATAGNPVWGPQIFNGQSGAGFGPLVPVVQGWFNVILGPTDTNGATIGNAFSGTIRYLEIQLGSNAPFSPRQPILSSPYALMAGNVPDGSITGAKIANSAVGSNQLAPGVIRSRGLGTNLAQGDVAVSAVQLMQIAREGDGETELSAMRLKVICSGRPVIVHVTGDGEASSGLYAERQHQSVEGAVLLRRNGTALGRMQIFAQTQSVAWWSNQGSQAGWPTGSGVQTEVPGSWTFVDASPPLGTNTYTFHIATPWNEKTGVVAKNLKMTVYEL